MGDWTSMLGGGGGGGSGGHSPSSASSSTSGNNFGGSDGLPLVAAIGIAGAVIIGLIVLILVAKKH